MFSGTRIATLVTASALTLTRAARDSPLKLVKPSQMLKLAVVNLLNFHNINRMW